MDVFWPELLPLIRYKLFGNTELRTAIELSWKNLWMIVILETTLSIFSCFAKPSI